MKVWTRNAAGIGFVLAGLTAGAYSQSQPQGVHLQPTGELKPSAALPASAPTAPVPLPQQRSTTPAATVRRARVDYAAGLLTVRADNSSLNQILREIARLTGIKITGGVIDERVYGTYGPSDLPTILAVLLDGTGSNMMLSGDDPGTPQALTLTPRQGGASPPSPQQLQANDDSEPAQDLPPQLTPRTANNVIGATPVNPPQPQPFTPPAVQPTATSAAPAADTTSEQSPNGVKTPQQIYDQLMKLQSQQPKAPQ